MLRKQTVLLTLTTLLTTGAIAQAEVPTSQFGFTGWPYRNEAACGSGNVSDSASSVCPTDTAGQATVCTVSPTCAPATPCVTTKPTACPTAVPESTSEVLGFGNALDVPATKPSAKPTACPSDAVKPTDAVIPTAKPQATATSAPVVTATSSPVVTPMPTPSMDEDYTTGSVGVQEQNAANLVNQDRNSNGLSALTLDPALCALARRKSEDMRDNRYFAHTSPTYGSASDMLKQFGYSFSAVGENIAHHATVEKAQAAFMTSDGHRRNILGTSWVKMGIGVAYDSQGFVYVTQLFVR